MIALALLATPSRPGSLHGNFHRFSRAYLRRVQRIEIASGNPVTLRSPFTGAAFELACVLKVGWALCPKQC